MDQLVNFQVIVYGDLTQQTDVLSKARCRIFYKGANRNGGYITDEFADKLLSTLPYTPIKGIFDEDDGFSDHGESRDEGRIYGIVPQDPHISWENHYDEDGVLREYACADVLLFTAIYNEAKTIVNQPQSMELYAPSIKGEWFKHQGQTYYRYTDACFLGLQVLGTDTEPCFEGAAFYTLYNSLKELLDTAKLETHRPKEEFTLNFKLSDATKADMIWKALNPNYTKEGDWTVDYGISDIYDDYALIYSYEDSQYARQYYTKNDTEDTVTLGDKVPVFIIDVTATEKASLEALITLNGGSYELIDEHYSQLTTEKTELESQIIDNATTIATLTEDKEKADAELIEVSDKFAQASATVDNLTIELEELKEFKLNQERIEKQHIINKYSERLEQATLDEFAEKVDEYTALDLERDLAFQLVTTTSILNYKPATEGFIPKGEEEPTGATAILAKYAKNKH